MISLKRFSWLLLLLFITLRVSVAQDEIRSVHWGEAGEKLSTLIDESNLRSYLNTLASPAFQGRETGSEGIDKAAVFLTSKLKSFGIAPVSEENQYFQPIAFTWISWDQISAEVNGTTFKHLWDFIAFAGQNDNVPSLQASEVIFLGYGIDDPAYSDYKGVDVRGKVIMVYKGEPTDKKGNSWITRDAVGSVWNQNLELKVQTAAKYGASCILFIEDDIKKILAENRNQLIMPNVILGDNSARVPAAVQRVQISTNLAKAIIGDQFKKLVKVRERIQKKGKPAMLSLPVDMKLQMKQRIDRLDGSNIAGYIPGSDPALQQELIVVSAHYDHLGMRGDNIFHGADDNGSGSSGILELARVFQLAKDMGLGARRSVLFLWVTGEEKGLLGSKYYVENPLFPLEKTVANINIDMIGRLDKNHEDNPNYIYVIGSDKMSMDLHNINEESNARYTKLELDYRYNDENDPNRFYYRSDHYNFVLKGIPAIFYFSGVHDDYHRPSDTADKIRYDKMVPICQLAFHVAWELANRDERISLKAESKK
jgi:hypothetical protein